MESHNDKTNDKNLSGPAGGANDFPDDALESRAGQKPTPSISERKLAANRRNAQRSTGPKTPEGKQRSAQNSYKSGIFVRQLFVNTDSGRKEWEGYKGVAEDIYEHYQPEGFIEEMLADKVIAAAIRVSRVLWFESEVLARKDAFWGSTVDKVLRYQTATDRQLTKAIELLEAVQRKRKQAKAGGETDPGPECGEVPMRLCDTPWAPGSGDQERLATEDSDLPGTNPLPAESPSEAIARRSSARTFGAISPIRVDKPGGAPQGTENYKTKPPTSSSSGEADAMSHEKARQEHSLPDSAEPVAGLAASPESNNEPVPPLSSENKSPDATVPGPTEDEVLDCL